MINKKHKDQIMVNLLGSGLGSLLIVILITIIGSLSKYDIIDFFGGVTKPDLRRIMVSSPVFKTGFTTDGIYMNNPYPIENQFHRSVRDKHIKKKTEVITVDLEFKKKTVIIVTASLKCRYSIRESYPPIACAISKIYIDKIEGPSDTSNSNGLLDFLSCSVTEIKELNPGRHKIKVEGTFYGYDDNPHVDAEVKYTLINYSDTPLKGIDKEKNK